MSSTLESNSSLLSQKDPSIKAEWSTNFWGTRQRTRFSVGMQGEINAKLVEKSFFARVVNSFIKLITLKRYKGFSKTTSVRILGPMNAALIESAKTPGTLTEENKSKLVQLQQVKLKEASFPLKQQADELLEAVQTRAKEEDLSMLEQTVVNLSAEINAHYENPQKIQENYEMISVLQRQLENVRDDFIKTDAYLSDVKAKQEGLALKVSEAKGGIAGHISYLNEIGKDFPEKAQQRLEIDMMIEKCQRLMDEVLAAPLEEQAVGVFENNAKLLLEQDQKRLEELPKAISPEEKEKVVEEGAAFLLSAEKDLKIKLQKYIEVLPKRDLHDFNLQIERLTSLKTEGKSLDELYEEVQKSTKSISLLANNVLDQYVESKKTEFSLYLKDLIKLKCIRADSETLFFTQRKNDLSRLTQGTISYELFSSVAERISLIQIQEEVNVTLFKFFKENCWKGELKLAHASVVAIADEILRFLLSPEFGDDQSKAEYSFIKEQFQQFVKEQNFNLSQLKEALTQCHQKSLEWRKKNYERAVGYLEFRNGIDKYWDRIRNNFYCFDFFVACDTVHAKRHLQHREMAKQALIQKQVGKNIIAGMDTIISKMNSLAFWKPEAKLQDLFYHTQNWNEAVEEMDSMQLDLERLFDEEKRYKQTMENAEIKQEELHAKNQLVNYQKLYTLLPNVKKVLKDKEEDLTSPEKVRAYLTLIKQTSALLEATVAKLRDLSPIEQLIQLPFGDLEMQKKVYADSIKSIQDKISAHEKELTDLGSKFDRFMRPSLSKPWHKEITIHLLQLQKNINSFYKSFIQKSKDLLPEPEKIEAKGFIKYTAQQNNFDEGLFDFVMRKASDVKDYTAEATMGVIHVTGKIISYTKTSVGESVKHIFKAYSNKYHPVELKIIEIDELSKRDITDFTTYDQAVQDVLHYQGAVNRKIRKNLKSFETVTSLSRATESKKKFKTSVRDAKTFVKNLFERFEFTTAYEMEQFINKKISEHANRRGDLSSSSKFISYFKFMDRAAEEIDNKALSLKDNKVPLKAQMLQLQKKNPEGCKALHGRYENVVKGRLNEYSKVLDQCKQEIYESEDLLLKPVHTILREMLSDETDKKNIEDINTLLNSQSGSFGSVEGVLTRLKDANILRDYECKFIDKLKEHDKLVEFIDGELRIISNYCVEDEIASDWFWLLGWKQKVVLSELSIEQLSSYDGKMKKLIKKSKHRVLNKASLNAFKFKNLW